MVNHSPTKSRGLDSIVEFTGRCLRKPQLSRKLFLHRSIFIFRETKRSAEAKGREVHEDPSLETASRRVDLGRFWRRRPDWPAQSSYSRAPSGRDRRSAHRRKLLPESPAGRSEERRVGKER